MIIRKVGVVSLARILATIYAVFGLIAGAVLTIVALAGFDLGESSDELARAVFGPAAIILLPIFYGIVGYLAGAVAGWVFNYAAAMWGGLEIEVTT